jgi:transposase
MPAQYVKPYVKTNKSDYIDAEAIAEVVQRSNMRFVPIKTEEQLDLQAVHRVREHWVRRRTAVVNQIRSLLLERGLTLPKGRWHVEEAFPDIVEDGTLNLSGPFRALLAQLNLELDQLSAQIESMNAVIKQMVAENEACQRPFPESARSLRPRWSPRSAMQAAFEEGAIWRRGSEWSHVSTPPVAGSGR